MILFQNSLVTLTYKPATDVLEVQYPDLHGYLLPEIRHTINILVDMIRNYDVKRVLLDSTKTEISVSAEESREVTQWLAVGFMTTRLQKVARLQSKSEAVEKTAASNIAHVRQVNQLPFAVENFLDYNDAITWLTGTTP
ncbi:hypothetical protein [Pontibacter burrus]|uniref:STAS/SEC14 domain-containing protein n=1 Tax=Pontibacter burrus TaxID=2704466 RepID=A0A6B3LXR4_9BACT|nr:hypothetical protein [Pontibacter burrus]NEM99126.1 hypothetical protein [Pontibacter burrus]